MKELLIAILFLLSLTATNRQNKEGVLLVKVSNLSEVEGNLMVAVFTNEKEFPDADYALQQLVYRVSGNTTTIKIKNLVVGTKYALAVYHDKNGNQKLDKNFLGIPTERYGFSKNARGMFGPPPFKDAAFVYSDDGLLEIKVE